MAMDQREVYTLISLAMLYSPNTSTRQPSMIGDNRVTNRIGAIAGGRPSIPYDHSDARARSVSASISCLCLPG
jgi:hypothetical protein